MKLTDQALVIIKDCLTNALEEVSDPSSGNAVSIMSLKGKGTSTGVSFIQYEGTYYAPHSVGKG